MGSGELNLDLILGARGPAALSEWNPLKEFN
jgi:hypothetical protein